jgi:integrase
MMTKSAVLAKAREVIRMRHYAYSTEDLYLGWIGRYYDFCRTLKAPLAPEEKAEAFLTHLAVHRKVAAGTQNQAFAALLFLYKDVQGRPLGDVSALRARRPRFERTSPSREQIRRFLSAVEDTPMTPLRLLVDLLYGCGIRVSEPLELRTKDVLWDDGPCGQLVLRGAKGGKDRRVPIPRKCVEPLREQLARARAVWAWDQASRPVIGVPLPHALARKYPKAPFQWPWYWVFPANAPCRDPRSGLQVRFHVLVDSVQRGVQKAAEKVELGGLITPHVLRHAYATHSREPIGALRVLLGHSSLETTAAYLHPEVDRAGNPLDDLPAEPPPPPAPGGHPPPLPPT